MIRIGNINDVQDQIGFNDLLQCCAKCGDQLMRQFPNEANSIRNQNRKISSELNSPDQRVQRREQAFRDKRVFLGQSSKKGRFAGICVADQRNQGEVLAAAPFPVQLPVFSNLLYFSLERADPVADLPAVYLLLCRAGTPCADSAAQTREIVAVTGQSRQSVL